MFVRIFYHSSDYYKTFYGCARIWKEQLLVKSIIFEFNKLNSDNLYDVQSVTPYHW